MPLSGPYSCETSSPLSHNLVSSHLISALTQQCVQVGEAWASELITAASRASAAASGALASLASWPSLPPDCESLVKDALPQDYDAVGRVVALLSRLPAGSPSAASTGAGLEARGGAEHAAYLLAAVVTSLDDGVELVASALLDSAGTLEVLLGMLPQPPVTTGEVVPDFGEPMCSIAS
eukprot:scaffold210385_cov42-Prasinocladus_malaysianus.AAC.1